MRHLPSSPTPLPQSPRQGLSDSNTNPQAPPQNYPRSEFRMILMHIFFSSNTHVSCYPPEIVSCKTISKILGSSQSIFDLFFEHSRARPPSIPFNFGSRDQTIFESPKPGMDTYELQQKCHQQHRQNQPYQQQLYVIRDDVKLDQLVRARDCLSGGRRFDSGKKSNNENSHLHLST